MGQVVTINFILQVRKLRIREDVFQSYVFNKLANVEFEQSESIHFYGTFI